MKKIAQLVALATVTIIFASCEKKAALVYDRSLEQMVEQTQQEGRDYFFVVLSRPDCPPCASYVKNLDDKKNRRIIGKTIINVVDLSQPENAWYSHWLCIGAYPTTCVFSADGELKAIVSGNSARSIECIRSSIKGEVKCADYLYEKRYPIVGNYLTMLNRLLVCKQGIDKGEDVGEKLDGIMKMTDYPYPTYLKALNEDKQGRRDVAVQYAEQVLEYDDMYYYYVYDDIFRQSKYIINPDYSPQEDGMLSMEEEILLGDCQVGSPRAVTIRVENTGKFPAFIRDIRTSCTCVELLSPLQHRLEPGESVGIDVEFTGENKGEVYREVLFFSNSSEPLKRVALRATVI